MGPIGRVVLEDAGVRVAVVSLGGAVQDWRVPLDGAEVPVVLGFADPQAYTDNSHFMGAIVGRVANRIGGAAYTQDGQRVALEANDGPHQLHGGPRGLSAVNWQIDPDGPRRLRLSYDSPAGEGGFPGRVAFVVDMALEAGRLTWDMFATPDRETPISLAQHNYYALAPSRLGQRVSLAANRRLIRDHAGIMTGAIVPDPTLQDGRALPATPADAGVLDDFLLFDECRDPAAPVAEVTAPNGLRLRLWSDQPGAQIYTGQLMPPTPGGHPERPLGPCAGLCIEPSGYPNALNKRAFPSIFHSPDHPYQQRLSVEILKG